MDVAAGESSVSERIADWIAGLRSSDLPDVVRSACSDTILDTVGLVIAALDTDYGRAVRRAFPDEGSCTVFGLAEGRAAVAAAVINGTCGHGEDFDNTYEGCPVHSGVVIVPALTAAGEMFGLSNTQVAKGIAVGTELMCRMGLVAQKAIHAAGFHPTAILGAIGAAAGVAAATRQNRQQIADTLGVAGSMASGIIEYLADGSWTKRMHPGWAAQAGLRAAMMGAAGFSGPRTVLEGTHGLYAAFAPSIEPVFSPLVQDLGSRWEAARIAFKPYACGTMAQPYVDCAVRLAERGVDPRAIESIVCEVGEGTVHRLWEPLTTKQSPPTPYAAKFSTPYCVAVGFLRRDAGLAEFTEEAVRDPEILALARRVAYVIDPANEYPKNYTGHVRAALRNGDVVEERQPQMRGGTRQPLSREDLLRKCSANLGYAGRPHQLADEIARFAEAVMTTDDRFDASVVRR